MIPKINFFKNFLFHKNWWLYTEIRFFHKLRPVFAGKTRIGDHIRKVNFFKITEDDANEEGNALLDIVREVTDEEPPPFEEVKVCLYSRLAITRTCFNSNKSLTRTGDLN